ncbi:hypothetical protein [Mangrovimonas cancribranchiae]|uniref:DoxX family protein n=1 Tax=Mangrovimonas cancribranchiae TaxID=3080055 RepID=A0AAU6PAT6_9FLAO
MNRKIMALILSLIGVLLSIAFFVKIEFPQGFENYFKREYYNQFGPMVISVELLTASYYLFIGHKNTNFALAVFGCTALLDPIFNQIGFLNSNMPLYGTIIFSICALLCLWLAFLNPFNLNRMSILSTLVSVVLSVLIELFFNYPG